MFGYLEKGNLPSGDVSAEVGKIQPGPKSLKATCLLFPFITHPVGDSAPPILKAFG